MSTVPLEEQIKEVKRELGLRERVYPRWIAAKKLWPDDADRHMAAMRAALETLHEVAQSRRLL